MSAYKNVFLRKKKEVLGVTLAVTGIFLIATHGNPTSLALSQKALIMGLISAVSVVIYTIKPARLQAQFDTPLVLAWGMLIGRRGAYGSISSVELSGVF